MQWTISPKAEKRNPGYYRTITRKSNQKTFTKETKKIQNAPFTSGHWGNFWVRQWVRICLLYDLMKERIGIRKKEDVIPKKEVLQETTEQRWATYQ